VRLVPRAMRQRGTAAAAAARKEEGDEKKEDVDDSDSQSMKLTWKQTVLIIVGLIFTFGLLLQVSELGRQHAIQHDEYRKARKAGKVSAVDSAVQQVIQQAESIEKKLQEDADQPKKKLSEESDAVFREISKEAKLLSKMHAFIRAIEALSKAKAITEATYAAYDAVLVKIEAEVDSLTDKTRVEKMKQVADIARNELIERMKEKSIDHLFEDFEEQEYFLEKMGEYKEKQKQAAQLQLESYIESKTGSSDDEDAS